MFYETLEHIVCPPTNPQPGDTGPRFPIPPISLPGGGGNPKPQARIENEVLQILSSDN